MELWFTEKQTAKVGLTCKVIRTLADEHTPFQHLAVLETEQFGRMLVLDGIVQTTVADEFVYHEMITHPALSTHGSPKRVLVIGGGDGGAVREILKHETVEKVELCEIDRRVVDVCRELLPETSCALGDRRVKLIFDDGIEYLRHSNTRYDCIIVDSPDPIGPAEGLFAGEFYQSIHDHLTDEGVFAAQTESPFYNQDLIERVTRDISAVFPICGLYLASIPTYPSGMWSFTLGSKKHDPRQHIVGFGGEATCRYYSRQLQRTSFSVPAFVRDLLPERFIS